MSDELITVYLSREYGFDEWIWRTGMTEAALREFWEGIENMRPYCRDLDSLPGKLEPCAGEDTVVYLDGKKFYEVWTAHIHINKDSALYPPSPSEERYARKIVHRRYGENEE